MKLQYHFGLRHRATLEEKIGDRHSRLIAKLRELAPPWGIPSTYVAEEPVVAPGNLSVRVQLKGILGSPIKGYVAYPLRKDTYLDADNAQFDDILIIEFAPSKIDYGDFVRTVFPRYVDAFDAYRAVVKEESTVAEDWPEIVQRVRASGKDIDGRDGVHRISAVNYYDSLLCQRAFGRSPAQIVARLKGAVEDVVEFRNGVLLVVDSNVLPKDALWKIDRRVRDLLE
jgi:hypothetical protein